MDKLSLIQQIKSHQVYNAAEAAHQRAMIAFLEATPEPFHRTTTMGHITGSAVLFNSEQTAIWLLWHDKLQRWLQPGGHCEPYIDADVVATATRELTEETALSAQDVLLLPDVYDLDVHTIPARGLEAEHRHFDVRFGFVWRGTGELAAGKWVKIAELAAFPEESLARLAQKFKRH
jgi:8-oxo-dGTP pyrophosphatase MutT (NUDIX family)